MEMILSILFWTNCCPRPDTDDVFVTLQIFFNVRKDEQSLKNPRGGIMSGHVTEAKKCLQIITNFRRRNFDCDLQQRPSHAKLSSLEPHHWQTPDARINNWFAKEQSDYEVVIIYFIWFHFFVFCFSSYSYCSFTHLPRCIVCIQTSSNLLIEWCCLDGKLTVANISNSTPMSLLLCLDAINFRTNNSFDRCMNTYWQSRRHMLS